MPRTNITTLEMIGKGSLSMQAYRVLRQALVNGHFLPGQRLIMAQLAQDLGVSITPAREACMRLAAEHALEVISGRFVQVPQFTVQRYLDVRMIRLELECLATALAAERASAADVERLLAMIPDYERTSEGGDQVMAGQYNRDFHFAIYRLSGVELLVDQIDNLWTLMGPMLAVFFRESARLYTSSEEHRAAVEAIGRRDGAAAAAAMRRDILRGGEDILAYLKSGVAVPSHG